MVTPESGESKSAACGCDPGCDTCIGRASEPDRSGPRLDWALRTSLAHAGMSDFWAAATFAETFKGHPPSTQSKDRILTEVLDTLLLHTSASSAESGSAFTLAAHQMGLQPRALVGGMFGFENLQSDAALGAGAKVELHPDVQPQTEMPKAAGQSPKEAYREFLLPLVRFRTESGGGGMECCAEVEPPVPIPFEKKAESAPWQTFVGWKFTISAIFKNISPCRCTCCEYHQFVNYFVRLWSAGGRDAAPPEQTGGFREDCLPRPGGKDICPGSNDPAHQYPPGAKSPVTGEVIEEREITDTECSLTYRDAPGRWVRWGLSYYMRFEFIFVVFDVCHNYAIKYLLHTQLEREGTVSLSGDDSPADRGTLP